MADGWKFWPPVLLPFKVIVFVASKVPVSVKPGDVILFAKWASSANEVKIEGKDYVLIKESDILGIL